MKALLAMCLMCYNTVCVMSRTHARMHAPSSWAIAIHVLPLPARCRRRFLQVRLLAGKVTQPGDSVADLGTNALFTQHRVFDRGFKYDPTTRKLYLMSYSGLRVMDPHNASFPVSRYRYDDALKGPKLVGSSSMSFDNQGRMYWTPNYVYTTDYVQVADKEVRG